MTAMWVSNWYYLSVDTGQDAAKNFTPRTHATTNEQRQAFEPVRCCSAGEQVKVNMTPRLGSAAASTKKSVNYCLQIVLDVEWVSNDEERIYRSPPLKSQPASYATRVRLEEYGGGWLLRNSISVIHIHQVRYFAESRPTTAANALCIIATIVATITTTASGHPSATISHDQPRPPARSPRPRCKEDGDDAKTRRNHEEESLFFVVVRRGGLLTPTSPVCNWAAKIVEWPIPGKSMKERKKPEQNRRMETLSQNTSPLTFCNNV